MWYEFFVDNKVLPDRLLRYFIRIALNKYYKKIQEHSESEILQIQKNFRQMSKNSEMTIHANLANSQHYELPTINPICFYYMCLLFDGFSFKVEGHMNLLRFPYI